MTSPDPSHDPDQVAPAVANLETIVSLSKRRGFIFPSSEIYGGLNGFWDYGPLGVELKRNIKDAWWVDNVRARDDMVGLDCAIIMNPKIWEASGHLGGFSDVGGSWNTPNETFRVNAEGTLNVLQACVGAGVRLKLWVVVFPVVIPTPLAVELP